MSNYICKVCEKHFDKEINYFDREQNRCILHSNKSETNDWYTVDELDSKNWNFKKVNLFWKYIQK